MEIHVKYLSCNKAGVNQIIISNLNANDIIDMQSHKEGLMLGLTWAVQH